MKKEHTFEEAMKRLDVIVHLLEKGDATLEESIQIFEEGLELVAHCDSQLKAFDQKLQDVLQKHQFSLNQHRKYFPNQNLKVIFL